MSRPLYVACISSPPSSDNGSGNPLSHANTSTSLPRRPSILSPEIVWLLYFYIFFRVCDGGCDILSYALTFRSPLSVLAFFVRELLSFCLPWVGEWRALYLSNFWLPLSL